MLLTISDLQTAITSVGGMSRGCVIHDLHTVICIYFSKDSGVWVEVSVIHDLRSAICIYFNGGMSVGVGVSVIDDEQSAICVYFSEGREVEVGESVIHIVLRILRFAKLKIR